MTSSMEDRINNAFVQVLTVPWNRRDVDGELIKIFRECINLIGADGVAIRIRGQKQIYFVMKRSLHGQVGLVKGAITEIEEVFDSQSISYCFSLNCWPKKKCWLVVQGESESDYFNKHQCCFFFDDNPKDNTITKELNSLAMAAGDGGGQVKVIRPLALLLVRALRVRCKAFRGFPNETAWRYWYMTERGSKDAKPPCVKEGETETITLVLDLRRSTTAMKHAASNRDFAEWLSQFTNILGDISRRNKAVFDKFTGDGVMVHYPIREFVDTPGMEDDDAFRAIFSCAFEMIEGAKYHTRKLEKLLLRHDPAFGPVVGVAVADANWSMDTGENPIVVGKGVVEACRIVNAEVKDSVLLGLNVLRRLESAIKCEITTATEYEPSEKSKEHERDPGTVIWVLDGPPPGIKVDRAAIKKICKQVYGETEASDKSNW